MLRAILKAADVCAAEPEKVARFLAAKLYEPRYPIGLEVMKRAQYSRWREANPEDTLRFHALRLHEVGMIKTAPPETHRPGDGLAVLERAETGAEDLARLPLQSNDRTIRYMASDLTAA